MYRLDVREDLFRDALLQPDDAGRAAAIADLIMNREIQRLEFRKKYNPKP
jgi:hypothetical protein